MKLKMCLHFQKCSKHGLCYYGNQCCNWSLNVATLNENQLHSLSVRPFHQGRCFLHLRNKLTDGQCWRLLASSLASSSLKQAFLLDHRAHAEEMKQVMISCITLWSSSRCDGNFNAPLKPTLSQFSSLRLQRSTSLCQAMRFEISMLWKI